MLRSAATPNPRKNFNDANTNNPDNTLRHLSPGSCRAPTFRLESSPHRRLIED